MIIFSQYFPGMEEMISDAGRTPEIYNLSSYCSQYPTLGALAPNSDIMGAASYLSDFDGMEFDMAYMQYIMNDNVAFSAFITLIMKIFDDPELVLVLLVSDSPYRDSIKESLAKIIQQRYGYLCHMVNTVEDLYEILIENEEPTFSIMGLGIYQKDRDRAYYSSDMFIN